MEYSAIYLFKGGYGRLLLAGENPNEMTRFVKTPENLRGKPFYLSRREMKRVRTQVNAANTPEQVAWVADRVAEENVTSIALSVSSYHMVRAYLTLLKGLARRGIRIPIYPSPPPVPLHLAIPEYGEEMGKMVPGELARIRAYREKGDVATHEELREYLVWLWRQKPLEQIVRMNAGSLTP